MVGTVEGLYTCPEAGMPMIAQDFVLVLPEKGISDDRYGRGIGSYSNAKRKTIRQVSFVAVEDINEANSRELPHAFTPEETRRNILTKGIDLRSLIGKTFTVGTARFLGIEECTPCKRPSELLNKNGFKEAFKGLGGLRAQVIVGGIVQVGDAVAPTQKGA